MPVIVASTLLNLDGDGMRERACKSLYEVDLREDNGAGKQPAPKMNRVDSYRVPPLKVTLETIEEDQPGYEKPDYLARSKSLPTQRRCPLDSSGLGLSRLPSYRPGQEGGHLAEDREYGAGDGTYFAGDGNFRAGGGGYGVSMSGPILSTPGDYKFARKSHRSRLSITKMRDAIRHSRLRGAFSQFLSRMRPSSRRSH